MTRPFLTVLPCALLLLTLSACADGRSSAGTAERACEDAADSDPGLQRDRFAALTNGGGSANMAFQRKRSDMVNACLRRKGVLPLGGVQRPLS
jgi:hypothetical protein